MEGAGRKKHVMRGGARTYAVTGNEVYNDFSTLDDTNLATALAANPNNVVMFIYMPALPGPPPTPHGVSDDPTVFNRANPALVSPAPGASGWHSVVFGTSQSLLQPRDFRVLMNPAFRIFVQRIGRMDPVTRKDMIRGPDGPGGAVTPGLMGFPNIAALNAWLGPPPAPPPPPPAPPAPPPPPPASSGDGGSGAAGGDVGAVPLPAALARYANVVDNAATGHIWANLQQQMLLAPLVRQRDEYGRWSQDPVLFIVFNGFILGLQGRGVLPPDPAALAEIPLSDYYCSFIWMIIRIVNGADDIPDAWLDAGGALSAMRFPGRGSLEDVVVSVRSLMERVVKDNWKHALDNNDENGWIEAARELERALVNAPPPPAGAVPGGVQEVDIPMAGDGGAGGSNAAAMMGGPLGAAAARAGPGILGPFASAAGSGMMAPAGQFQWANYGPPGAAVAQAAPAVAAPMMGGPLGAAAAMMGGPLGAAGAAGAGPGILGPFASAAGSGMMAPAGQFQWANYGPPGAAVAQAAQAPAVAAPMNPGMLAPMPPYPNHPRNPYNNLGAAQQANNAIAWQYWDQWVAMYPLAAAQYLASLPPGQRRYGGAIRSSLPTRRAGRSSSSRKRRYTHRRRALRIGKGGYRSTKKNRKV